MLEDELSSGGVITSGGVHTCGAALGVGSCGADDMLSDRDGGTPIGASGSDASGADGKPGDPAGGGGARELRAGAVAQRPTGVAELKLNCSGLPAGAEGAKGFQIGRAHV